MAPAKVGSCQYLQQQRAVSTVTPSSNALDSSRVTVHVMGAQHQREVDVGDRHSWCFGGSTSRCTGVVHGMPSFQHGNWDPTCSRADVPTLRESDTRWRAYRREVW